MSFVGEGAMNKKAFIIGIIGVFFFIQLVSAQTWTVDKRLTWNPGNSIYPDAAGDSNNHIHLVWADDTTGNREIYYKRYLAIGNRWITKRLTYNPGNSVNPALALDSNDYIHLVWYDDTPWNYEIFYKRSEDGGAKWTTERLTFSPGHSLHPAIAVDSNDYVHVVWCDEASGNLEIYYAKSKGGITTWKPKRLTWTSDESLNPAIAVDAYNYIHVVWSEIKSGDGEIFYKKSTDGGSTWKTKPLTFNLGSSGHPAIAINSSSHIHVVWDDDTHGNFEICFRSSTDGGSTWTLKRLTYNPGHSSYPDIAVDSSDHIHVVWCDDTPGNMEIYYKISEDGGILWKTKRLTHKPTGSLSPAIAVDTLDRIYVVWEDQYPGNFEIYYKKGIQ